MDSLVTNFGSALWTRKIRPKISCSVSGVCQFQEARFTAKSLNAEQPDLCHPPQRRDLHPFVRARSFERGASS